MTGLKNSKPDSSRANNICTVAAVTVLIFVISVSCLLSPENEFSESERRRLSKFPDISAETLLNGKFMEEFEEYSLDQFPFRDGFRRIKAIARHDLFRLRDNNGIYIENSFAAKIIYPLNEASVLNAAAKFTDIYNTWLTDSGRIVVSIVPDKGYFLSRSNGYPCMDYERLEKLLTDNMPYAQYCSIMDTLSINDYYKTDTHWTQDSILPAAEKIASALSSDPIPEYTVNVAEVDFYGVYYGQSALPLSPDRIRYITNDAISAAAVYNAETDSTGGVYDPEKLHSRDPYEFFLSGAAAVLTIENPLSENDRELIIFRDSFASSIAPCFINGYSKITLVDTRYISPSLLGDYVDFTDCDVLFLYSTLVLNDSQVLK